MSKPSLIPNWAYDSSDYYDEPSESKREIGWTVDERPFPTHMNWIHKTTADWLSLLEKKTEFKNICIYGEGLLAWNSGTLFIGNGAGENIIVRVFREGVFQELIIPGDLIGGTDSQYSFSDNQVMVMALPDDLDATYNLQFTGYNGSTGCPQGRICIVNEGSLIEENSEREIILFKREGTSLLCPINGQIFRNATGYIYNLGSHYDRDLAYDWNARHDFSAGVSAYDGSLSFASYSRNSASNTGLFFDGNSIKTTHGGVIGVEINSGAIGLPDGLASSPSLARNADLSAGLFFDDYILGWSNDGTARVKFDTNGDTFTQIQVPNNNSSSAPRLARIGNTTTGYGFSGSTTLALISNEVNVMSVGEDGSVVNINGSEATPCLRLNDNNSGLFVPASNAIGISLAGDELIRFDSSENVQIKGALSGATCDLGFVYGGPSGSSARGFKLNGSVTGDPYLAMQAIESSAVVFEWSTNYVIPGDDGTITLGLDDMRWAEIWCTQSSINSSSDIRFKENVEELDDYECLEKISKLKPISFKRKGKDKTYLGFSAQQTHKVFKDDGLALVHKPNNPRKQEWAMAYGELTAPLAGSIRALNKELVILKKQIEKMEARL